MDNDNTLRSVIRWSLGVVVICLIIYLAASICVAMAGSNEVQRTVAVSVLESTVRFGQAAWAFARPLLQLAVVLLIVDWLARRMGVRFGSQTSGITWNVQAILAVVVVMAFAISELSGIGGGGLKDVALVIVGFYFGTQRRALMTDPRTGKILEVEEHDNPVVRPEDGPTADAPKWAASSSSTEKR
jgi:hypothetical protein